MGSGKVLKCSFCEEPAITVVRYAKLRLCKKHFTEFVQRRVLKTIDRYGLVDRGWRVLVAVSGGKDSATLLHTLSTLSKELGFEVTALHIDLGIGKYSEKAKEAAEKLCRALEVPLVLLSLRELLSVELPELVAKSKRPACSVCGLVKRYLINTAALELRVQAVALGHHLDDLLPYIVKNFVLQNLGGISKLGPKTETEEVFVGRIRPLYEISESETALYAHIQGLPVVEEVCPYAVRGESLEEEIRSFLNTVEAKRPGFKVAFARAVAKNIEFYREEAEESINKCEYCEMPTASNICAFCKLTARVLGKPMGSDVRIKVRRILAEVKTL